MTGLTPSQAPTAGTRRSLLVASAGLLLAGSAGRLALPAAAASDVIVANGSARFGRARYRCAVGHGGIRTNKKEGDGATPAGAWPIRSVLYRADRIQLPKLAFKVHELTPEDGWCDAASDPMYNRPVKLPYAASAEKLWRDDGIYDVIVVLGYNDKPVVPGRGSAIFMHIARPNYSPTLGCVAFARENLLEILSHATRTTRVVIRKS
jgi:L,D-peptidoglycan transpeptidase YkuD (ErfK/YbiS/YcfS/YnhG family)